MNDIISFSKNWNNKLDANYFTTIRVHNPEKYKVGSLFNVQLIKNEKMIKSFFVKVESIKVKKLNEFTDYELSVDTGLPGDQAFKLLKSFYPNMDIPNTYFDFILLSRYEMDDLFNG